MSESKRNAPHFYVSVDINADKLLALRARINKGKAHVSVNDLSVGRNVDEVLRVLDALQTDELCPCNWKKGDKTLEAA